MPQPLRVLITGICFLLFSVGSGISAITILPFIRLTSANEMERQVRTRSFVHKSFRRMFRFVDLAGLCTLRVRGADTAAPKPPFVLIANHPSLIDVVALLAAVEGAGVIVKQAVVNSALIGSVARAANYLPAPAPGGNVVGIAPLVERMVQRLEAGESLIIFPEGTRSPIGGVHRFRRGAFEAAARAGVPVWPALIQTSEATLRSHQSWWEVPRAKLLLNVDFGEPFDVDPETNNRKLTRKVQNGYERTSGLEQGSARWRGPFDE